MKLWSPVPVNAVHEVGLHCVRQAAPEIQLYFEERKPPHRKLKLKLMLVTALRQQRRMSMSMSREPVAGTKTGKRQLRQSITPLKEQA